MTQTIEKEFGHGLRERMGGFAAVEPKAVTKGGGELVSNDEIDFAWRNAQSVLVLNPKEQRKLARS